MDNFAELRDMDLESGGAASYEHFYLFAHKFHVISFNSFSKIEIKIKFIS